MQKVTKAYKQSMKSPLRNRAFIMITAGLINQEVQTNATVENGSFSYFSDRKIFSNKQREVVYATLEENFTKADGSMFFLPRKEIGGWLETGITSKDLVSDGGCEILIKFNTLPTKLKGLTIQFGENYPVDFDVLAGSGQLVEVRGNDKAKWSTEEAFNDTTSLRFIFKKMKNEHSRVRIHSMMFGYGLIYYEDSVISATMDSYVSPIGADLPQIDFSVTLKNYDHYFDIDNPKSAINYLETGQEMNVSYGYELPSGEIEWVQGNNLLCSAWESDDKSATIKAHDIFRNMDSEYFKGTYSDTDKSYFTLATEILEDVGITKYYIDPRLKKLTTKNPIPRIRHKEALQMIANACRCSLTQSRNGGVQIKSNFIPEVSVSTNGETSYSKSANIKKPTKKAEYGSFAKNYTKTDGTIFFLSRNSVANLETGYISKAISNENGLFQTNPIVTFSMDGIRAYYGIKLVFGNAIPKRFVVRAYKESEMVNEYFIGEDEIEQTMVVVRDFEDCNEIRLEFIETDISFNRIVLNHFSLSDTSDFRISKNDMLSYPRAIKQELIKEVIVPCLTFLKGIKEDTIIQETVSAITGKEETFYLTDASHNYSVRLNEQTGLVDVVAQGSYFVKIRYKVTGNYKLEIRGYRYQIIERQSVHTLGTKGKTIKWKNPLIDDVEMAEQLAKWLAEHYKSSIEYEYDTRGNPELDCTDIIYQENDFVEDMKVNVYRTTLNFKDGFGGKVVARRVGG